MDHRVLTNFTLMLERRGYTDITVLTDEDEKVRVTATTRVGLPLLARFVSGEKLAISVVKECIAEFVASDGPDGKQAYRHGILVYEGNPTSCGKKMLNNLHGTGQVHVETHAARELLVDKLAHPYSLPHIRCRKREAAHIKKIYGLKLPILKMDDPMVRYYDFRGGDIIKIFRKNDALAYRLVNK